MDIAFDNDMAIAIVIAIIIDIAIAIVVDNVSGIFYIDIKIGMDFNYS